MTEMSNVNSHFNNHQLEILKNIGIVFDDNKDYSDDELINIHDTITEAYLDKCFDKKGNALPLAKDFEQIIDIFFDDFYI